MSRVLLVVAVVAVLATFAAASLSEPVLNDDLIAAINKKGAFEAGRNARFEGMSRAEARAMLGTKLRPSRLPKKIVEAAPGAIPASFDARTQWPHCIHPVLDQGQCGSCWAFGATEALSDRLCIGSTGKTSVVLSPQDPVSCNTQNYGCNGGYLDVVWNYMKSTGVVTMSCFPYVSGGSGSVPACAKSCKDHSTFTKYHAKTVYDVSATVAAIQTEIMTNGPVEAAFEVYMDFFSYKGGVYSHQSGSLDGGHAIKIVGWGTYQGTDFWMVQNSWGTSWGLSGFFMIKRGTNECGIESNVVAGLGATSANGLPIHNTPETDLTAPLLDDDIIDAVNSDPTSTWVAERSPRFEGMTRKDAKKMLGAMTDKLPETVPVVLHATDIPSSFDSRTQWPSCIHPIRDQAQCGSCWAFGATESLSDRFCIASNGATNVVLSPQQLVSCDTTDYGCNGGYLQNAWQFMSTNGVVADTCIPYTSGQGNTGTCPAKNTCTGTGPYKTYKVDASSIQTLSDVASIQTEIMTNGPVEASFSVYQDFFSYKGGVYSHKSGSLDGGHAIKVIGWGTYQGTDFWMVANSWGTSWGLSGFFMIKRGTNECGIESNVVLGTPVLN